MFAVSACSPSANNLERAVRWRVDALQGAQASDIDDCFLTVVLKVETSGETVTSVYQSVTSVTDMQPMCDINSPRVEGCSRRHLIFVNV